MNETNLGRRVTGSHTYPRWWAAMQVAGALAAVSLDVYVLHLGGRGVFAYVVAAAVILTATNLIILSIWRRRSSQAPSAR
jgi:hypothetical protein